MKYLGFTPLTYGLDIMRPLQNEARRRGDEFRWWLPPSLADRLATGEVRAATTAAVRSYAPDAVFSPVDWLPYWLPGRKVKVFHGFDTNKRDDDVHFRMRGWYDLLLTQGPSTTPRFRTLAKKLGYFEVRETGWAKLDPLFGSEPAPLPCPSDQPVVIYASTFSEKTCSVPVLAEEVEALIQTRSWYWLLTTHPKTDAQYRRQLQAIAARHDNAAYVSSHSLMPMLKAGAVMVCDTSSIVFEFLLQRRPVVTFRNHLAGPHLLDIQQPAELGPAVERALQRPDELMQAIADYGDYLHPYRDGCSAARCLDAVEAHIREFVPTAKKPVNLVRKMKLRRKIRQLQKQ